MNAVLTAMLPLPAKRRLNQRRRAAHLVFATLLLCLWQPVQAVYLSPDQQGEVLIFPYFTTRIDIDTLISIRNSQDQVKALKIRIIEGENGAVLHSFNIYLAPFDSWTAAITQFDERAQIATNDASCNVRFSNDPNQSFIAPLTLDALDSAPDSGRRSLDRSFEGYVEVIEMGNVDRNGLGANALFERSSNEPINCAALTAAWDEGGIWRQNPQIDMLPPSGGLHGDAVVIRVQNARAHAYQATALRSFYRPDASQPVSLHQAPESITPDLGAASPARSQLLWTPPAQDNRSELLEDTWEDSYQAVSAALMVDQLHNQFTQELSIGARSEWVLSFPTKPALTRPGAVRAPFTRSFDDNGPGQGDGQACEEIAIDVMQRNGVRPLHSAPPGTGTEDFTVALCYSVNVLSFNAALDSSDAVTHEAEQQVSDVLGSRLFLANERATPGEIFRNGWAIVRFSGLRNGSAGNFDHVLENPLSGRRYYGLPAIGVGFQAAQNAAINALFGTAAAHQRLPRIEP